MNSGSVVIRARASTNERVPLSRVSPHFVSSVVMSSVEETMAYDAFEAVVRARDASDDASLASTTRSAADEEVANARLVESRRALARTGALADVSDAYGAYVSLMRSGLWRDIAPRRASEDEGGYIYLLCDPTATPRERRKDTPRKARTRAVAVPFAVTRACATPAMFDALTHARGTSTVSIRRDARERETPDD